VARLTGVSVWFSSPRGLELRSETLPEVGAYDVRVEATASAISHGTEMLVFRGQVPDGLELDLPTLRGSFAFPIKYGYASAGRVVEIGSDVRCLALGDAVFVHHPHQSTYVVPADMPVRLPEEFKDDPTLGVFLANIETAANVVIDAAPRLGERVAVFGQGVVGLLITQLLRLTGVSQILVVEPVARRRELACEVGADVALEANDQVAGAIPGDSGRAPGPAVAHAPWLIGVRGERRIGQVVSQVELAPEGGGSFRMKSRFASYRNTPEMLRILHVAADVKTAIRKELTRLSSPATSP